MHFWGAHLVGESVGQRNQLRHFVVPERAVCSRSVAQNRFIKQLMHGLKTWPGACQPMIHAWHYLSSAARARATCATLDQCTTWYTGRGWTGACNTAGQVFRHGSHPKDMARCVCVCVCVWVVGAGRDRRRGRACRAAQSLPSQHGRGAHSESFY